MSDTTIAVPPKFTVGQKVRCIRGNGSFLEQGKIYEIDMLILCAQTKHGKDSGLLVHRIDTTHQPLAPIVWDTNRFEPIESSASTSRTSVAI